MTQIASQELTQALLYMDGVCVSFDGFKALNTLSLVIGVGEMRAIIGPNDGCHDRQDTARQWHRAVRGQG
jgi:ABC-type uncharacterized transport system ATPase subunit